jgi:hypothetical protein
LVTRPRYDWLKPVKQVKRRNDKRIIFFIFQRLLLFVGLSGWWVGFGCGWAKLNVVQKRWLVGRLAPLLILRSVGIASFILALLFIVYTVVIGLLVIISSTHSPNN